MSFIAHHRQPHAGLAKVATPEKHRHPRQPLDLSWQCLNVAQGGRGKSIASDQVSQSLHVLSISGHLMQATRLIGPEVRAYFLPSSSRWIVELVICPCPF